MTVLPLLLALNRKDSMIATLRAKRARVEKEFNEKVASARELERVMRRAVAVHTELETKIRAEEKAVADEEQRLIERRKAISSFSNYKLAQSAEREIEASSREVRLREEALLKVMSELDAAAQARSAAEVTFREAKVELEALAASGREVIAGVDAELATIEPDRAKLLAQLEEVPRREYEKVAKRYPSDPVAEIEAGVCGGCRMSVGPQALLSVCRGAITRCAGCGRILYSVAQEEESSK